MKNRVLYLLLLITPFVGCTTDTTDTLPTNALTALSVEVNNSGEFIDAVIDNERFEITIANVESGSSITDVNYSVADGVSLYPTPEEMIGSWTDQFYLNVNYGSAKQTYSVLLSDYVPTVIDPANYPAQATIYTKATYADKIENFFYDIKDANTKLHSETTASMLYQDHDLNGLRFPMRGVTTINSASDSSSSGHPAPGVINESVYGKYVTSLTNAVNARKANDNGDTDFGLFVSPKVSWEDDERNKPYWCTTKADYAQLFVDLVSYLKNKGFVVTHLGIDNEGASGYSSGDEHNTVVTKIKEGLTELDIDIPQIIGFEAWDPEKSTESKQYLKEITQNYPESMDIYGVHYYPTKDHVDTYKWLIYNRLDLAKRYPFWATEPHWNSTSEVESAAIYNGDMLTHADRAMCCLWAQIDIGMSGFCWWSYGTDATLRSQLMQVTSIPLRGAQPIWMKDHDDTNEMYSVQDADIVTCYENDGGATATYPNFTNKAAMNKLRTRSFIEGDQVTVYFNNIANYINRDEAMEYYSYVVQLDDAVVDGDIRIRQWVGAESAPADYTYTDVTDYKALDGDASKIVFDIPIRSITCMQFNIIQD